MALALFEESVAIRAPAAELRVQPSDIVFQNVAPGVVRLSVTVSNIGSARSQPTTMTIQAAPLGAFVPWKDVTSLAVPPIPPHSHLTVETDLTTPPPTKALGQFSCVPPRKLLTAIAAGDGKPRRSRAVTTTGSSIGQVLARLLGGGTQTGQTSQLPDDPLQLLSRPGAHWAGNINVLLGSRAVERHLAQALRIYPGRTNLAVFFCGDRNDEYQFTLSGDGAAWEAALFDVSHCDSLAQPPSPAAAIPQSKWIRMNHLRMILLAIYPPERAESGCVEVHIRQRSTNRDALVEFTLDAHAAGAGCYTV